MHSGAPRRIVTTIAYWIVAGIAAFAFLGAGFMKATTPKQKLAEKGMGWTENFSPLAVKLIGIAEILGAIGLIVPRLVNIAPVLGPIAAVALAVTMVGAIVVHARRKEAATPAIVLLVLSIAAAVLGFATL
ncbi:DoxX family protein [Aestuariimicrobium soli]|uniref:DoxX family protein n=1 Tax=Aestuariimicrobium soli TaxID=2035834 RepID=UPI003EB7652E